MTTKTNNQFYSIQKHFYPWIIYVKYSIKIVGYIILVAIGHKILVISDPTNISARVLKNLFSV